MRPRKSSLVSPATAHGVGRFGHHTSTGHVGQFPRLQSKLVVLGGLLLLIVVVWFACYPSPYAEEVDHGGGMVDRFGIYVYDDLPSELNFGALLANPDCGSSMFAAEIQIHQFLLQSKIRQYDPDKAALFYVPVYSSCILTKKRQYQRQNPHIQQRRAVKQALEFIKKNYKSYWERHDGRDHVWTFTHDFGSCMWHRENHPFVHEELGLVARTVQNSIILSTLGDNSSRCFNAEKDIVIPPFIDSDVIVEMATDLDKRVEEEVHRSRRKLAYFRGTVVWNWLGKPDLKYSRGIRQQIFDLYSNDPEFMVFDGSLDAERSYLDEMLNATFCLCPRGYASWSPRLVQSIALGCIPVVIADDTLHPFQNSKLFEGGYQSIAVLVAESKINHLKQILKAVPQDQIQAMRRALRRVWPLLQYKQIYDDLESALTLIEEALMDKSLIFGGAKEMFMNDNDPKS
eukprot:TRINITY_DN1176_c1_g1_i1.p1 TRINITY_DN1176_c1_g1~~TRINITY_DN1176_c1_g1_i1.p1  ORF type:complete len:457 (-),score=85.85 TRINITY_DN1176_c1_g1_i1:397-1767(-)